MIGEGCVRIVRADGLTLYSADMLEMFDPPINEIIKLVESQVEAAGKKGETIHVSRPQLVS